MRPPTFQLFCNKCGVFHMSFHQNQYVAEQWVRNMVDAHNPPAEPRNDASTADTQEVERRA